MSKHTPGPWLVKPAVEFADSAAIVNDRNYCIARLNRSQLLPELANARLIAAAPDLLAALDGLTRHSENINRAFYVEGTAKAMRPAMQGQKELLQAARAAIARANGGDNASP